MAIVKQTNVKLLLLMESAMTEYILKGTTVNVKVISSREVFIDADKDGDYGDKGSVSLIALSSAVRLGCPGYLSSYDIRNDPRGWEREIAYIINKFRDGKLSEAEAADEIAAYSVGSCERTSRARPESVERDTGAARGSVR